MDKKEIIMWSVWVCMVILLFLDGLGGKYMYFIVFLLISFSIQWSSKKFKIWINDDKLKQLKGGK